MKLLSIFPDILLFGQMTGALATDDTAAITLAGRVLAKTCTIDSSSAAQTVKLPDISDRDIVSVGLAGGLVEVPFVLKDWGTAVTAVKVTASGTADENNSYYFANTISAGIEGATGVGISLRMTDRSYPFTPNGHQSQTM